MAWEPLPEDHAGPTALGASLDRLHRTMGLARPDTVRLLERHWPSLMGADLAASCRLEAVREGELVVVVTDPAIAEHIAPAIAAEEAALGETGRVLIRPSGTEPLVRVMVEAPTAELAAAAADRLAAAVEAVAGGSAG